MNELVLTISEIIDAIPHWMLWPIAVIMMYIPINAAKSMCMISVRARPIWDETPENNNEETNRKPIPCDIHDDCSDCAFFGTSYCWKVMKHE